MRYLKPSRLSTVINVVFCTIRIFGSVVGAMMFAPSSGGPSKSIPSTPLKETASSGLRSMPHLQPRFFGANGSDDIAKEVEDWLRAVTAHDAIDDPLAG